MVIENQKVSREDFTVDNKRGTMLECSLFAPVNSKAYACVVYLHGNSGNKLSGEFLLEPVLTNKMALLTFDFHGCGNSEGKYISLGWYESQDLNLILKKLKTFK